VPNATRIRPETESSTSHVRVTQKQCRNNTIQGSRSMCQMPQESDQKHTKKRPITPVSADDTEGAVARIVSYFIGLYSLFYRALLQKRPITPVSGSRSMCQMPQESDQKLSHLRVTYEWLKTVQKLSHLRVTYEWRATCTSDPFDEFYHIYLTWLATRCGSCRQRCTSACRWLSFCTVFESLVRDS